MVQEQRSGEPLTSSQLDAVLNVASDMGFRYRLLVEVIPFTGLTLSEFCHLRNDWRRFTESDSDMFNIIVPRGSPCKGTLRTEPSGKAIEVMDDPCWLCRDEGEWTPSGECRHRVIPVAEPTARDALELCFDRFGMNSLPFTISSNFYDWMDEVATRAGLSRKFGFKALRRTYGRILIDKGFTSAEVAKYLGLFERHKTKPLYDAIDEPVDWESRACHSLSDEELIEALQRMYNRIGELPTIEIIEEEFEYSYQSLYNHFGGLRDALETAGINGYERHSVAISRDELLNELQRLADELGRPPSSREMDERGNFSKGTYYRDFDSWINALRTANIEIDDPTKYQSGKISRETLLEELHRLANELDRPPTQADVRNKGKYSDPTYVREFGGVKNARNVAGLGHPSENRISEDDLLKELRRLEDELGRPPVYTEIQKKAKFSITTYKNRFGGIVNARQAAGI